jgi:hypothetical protein
MSDLDEIEALAARQTKAAKEAAKYIPESTKTEDAGMFAGMGPMGSSYMAPLIAQPQKAEPASEHKAKEETGTLPKDFEQFVKKQEKASKIGQEFLPKEEQPKQAVPSDFPAIEAAKQSALSSIEDIAKGLYIDHPEPIQSYTASQLHSLSPSQITPEIKAEAAKVTDPEEIKQFPGWFPKTDEQHRAVFNQKHEDTNYGKEAWNVGVGLGKGLAESGVRFASGVAKMAPAFLQSPEDLANQEQWAQWGKNLLAPATSATETFESVAKTALNAASNGLSATDWLERKAGLISDNEAFDRYLRRQRADEYYEGWKKTDPNVFTRLIFEDPNTRELAEKMAYGLTSVWSPSVDDRLERFEGDREAALKEKQLDDLRDSQQLVSNFRREASQMVPESDITEALSYTRFGLNPFDVYGAAAQALGKGVKAAGKIGKTEAQLAEMNRAAAAKAFEQDLQKVQDSQTPGVFEQGFGKLASAIEGGKEKAQGALEKIPEFIGVPASKLGEGLLGGTALRLGGAALQAPRLMESALAGGRLAAGAEGKFLAGAKAATEKAGELGMTPAAQKWLADKSIPAAKALDWMAQNTAEMARGGVHGATLAAAVGILENKNPEEIADLMGQGVFFHVGGEVLGNMSGVSHARYEANQKRQRAGAAKWFNGLDGATKQHVTEFSNWDNYVQSLRTLADNAVGEHSQAQQELVNAVNSGEPKSKIAAAKEDADYTLKIAKTRRAMLQNAEKANAETRQMYADQIRIGMADLMTALNGSTPNRNVELRMTTAPQLIDEVLENNKDKGLTNLERIEIVNHLLANSGQIAFEVENGGKHRLSSGKTIDLYTSYKERLNVNIDAVKRRMGTGESVLNAVGHEAGHSFWNSKEFREANAQTIKDLFGNQRFDERGNLISGDAGILSTEDLVNKFKDVYAKGVNGGWEQLAKLTGLWDEKANDIDPAKTASYMKAEVMAELIQGGAQGGIKLGESPKPWLAPLVDWATVKNKNQKTVKSIRDAFGLTETKPWDSSLVGVTFSKDQVDATRKALRAVAELNGDITAAEIIPHAPITETQLRANEAVAKQFGDGFFATEKVATVVDENGNIVSSHVITDPGAMEGTFEHSITDTGDSELRQTSGYGTVPPELHDVELPKGGKLKITSRIKRDVFGGLAALTPEQAKALGRERARIIREALETAPDKEYPGRMSATSADRLSFGGILSPEQVKAIKRLPETIIPYGLKRRILEFNDLLMRDEGEGMIGLYGQAMDRYGRYKSFAPKIVDFVPLGMKISKDGNILFNMFSKTGMREKLRRWQRDTPELLNLWQGDGDAFMGDVRKVLDNWKPREGAPAGLPGETGLDSDPNIALAKKNRVNDFLNIFRKTEPESLLANPARSTMKRPARRLTKSEKLDEESSDPNTLIRSYRVDRFHDLEKSSDAPFRVNYGKALYNLMPAKEEAMPEREPRTGEPAGFGAGILKGLQAISAKYNPEGTGEFKVSVTPESSTRFLPEQKDEDPTMVAPGFFSKAGRVLLEKMPNRASASQIKGILNPQKGSGVKPDELKWSGILQHIDAVEAEKGFVTKDDITKFLKENYAAKFETKIQTQKGKSGFILPDFSDKVFDTEEEAKKEKELIARDFSMERLEASDEFTIFQDQNGRWKIFDYNDDPYYGGKTKLKEFYKTEKEAKEALFNDYLKEVRDLINITFATNTDETLYSKHKLSSPELQNYKETVLRMPEVEYTSSHFPNIPNYIAHMRTQDVGNYGLLIEELQSDLHQQSRKGTIEIDAPFRKDWSLQLFKHALQKAVADGKEWIGWTGGEAQAERYDLSKQVRLIKWTGYDSRGATKMVTITPTAGNDIELPVKADGHIIDNLGSQFDGKHLSDVLGKDLAKKILEQRHGDLLGDGLNVGGEGMKGFYDTILPKEIGKYVNQWGAKVEQGTVPNPKKAIRKLSIGYDGTNFFLNKGHFGERLAGVGPFKDYVEAEDARAALSKGQEQIWKVAITPEMSESVVGGQARFMPDAGEREIWTRSIDAAKETADKELERLRGYRLNLSDAKFEHNLSDDPEMGDSWSFVPPKDKYFDNPSMYDVYESDGKYYVGEGYGGGFKTLQDAQEDAMQRAMGESWKGSQSTFGSDADAQKAVGDIFNAFPKQIGDVTSNGWFSTKWGSWYLEGRIPTGENDYETFKLSIRDHPVSNRFQRPDKSFYVSKDWNPDEIANALKKAADWIANEATFAQPEANDAAAESAAPTENGQLRFMPGTTEGVVADEASIEPSKSRAALNLAAAPEAQKGALSGTPKPFEGAQVRFNPDREEETLKRMPMSAVEVLHNDSLILPKPEKKRTNADIAI